MQTMFPLITPEAKMLPFYITSIGLKNNQNTIQRKEGYTSYQISWCLKGTGKFRISGNEYEISENMGFFFCPHIPHEYFAIEEPWTMKWVAFDGHQTQYILSLLGIREYEVFYMPEFQQIGILIEDIYHIMDSNKPGKSLESSSMLFSLLVKWGEWLNKNKTTPRRKTLSKLQSVLVFMEENYGTNISLDDIASVINVSPDFLCRLFKQAYATSPIQYLINIRIQKAKYLLIKDSSSLIKCIANRVGFNDVSYFCSVFKEHEGLTPNEFRKLHGVRTE